VISTHSDFAHATHSGHAPQAARIGLMLPCYNEALNVDELYDRICAVISQIPDCSFTFLFIDNRSTDDTLVKLKAIADRDSRVTVIENSRNFGHIRSPFHGLLECPGDCVIAMATDLQDPPELIPAFLMEWRKGAAFVIGQKKTSEESPLFFLVRSTYYKIISAISDVPLLQHVTGFGLYDRRVIEIMRNLKDPYPYIRGMITEIGLPYVTIPYHQPLRRRGITKNNFMTLFDMAMVAVTSYSKLPLRLATLGGFLLSAGSLAIAITYTVAKLLFWDYLPAGYAPAVIGIFFLGSVQIFLIGLLGEYISAILTQLRNRPHVVEKSRYGAEINSSTSP
jgi:glycosyltransferase involved in cell wall biosynthesis